MTNPTQHGQVPEALRLAVSSSAMADEGEMIHLLSWHEIRNLLRADATELRRQHARIAELEAQIEALRGVQALSAAPAHPTVEQVEDEVSMGHGAWDMVDPQELIGAVLRLAASPTPPAEQQAAPKAAPGGREQAAPQQEAQEPCGWDGAEEWEKLAWHLCAEENGEDACNDLIWEGGIIPEPWGDRWLKYEDEARRMIDLVRTHVPAPQPAPAPLSEREAFEREWEKRHAPVPTNGRTRDDGRYGDSSIQDAWESWQARAALAAQGGKV